MTEWQFFKFPRWRPSIFVIYEAIFKKSIFSESQDSYESRNIIMFSISAILTKWQYFAIWRSAILEKNFIKFWEILSIVLNPTVQLASNSVGKWLRKSKWHSVLCIPRFTQTDTLTRTHTHTQIYPALLVINGNIIIGNVFHHIFVNSEPIFTNLIFLESWKPAASKYGIFIQIY